MGGGERRRQRLELGRAPPFRKRGRRWAGRGGAGERRRPLGPGPQVVPVVDQPRPRRRSAPLSTMTAARGHAADAPGERRAEEAPGVDAVQSERHEQRRHHVDRHRRRSEQHRADHHVERDRHRKQDAEDARPATSTAALGQPARPRCAICATRRSTGASRPSPRRGDRRGPSGAARSRITVQRFRAYRSSTQPSAAKKPFGASPAGVRTPADAAEERLESTGTAYSPGVATRPHRPAPARTLRQPRQLGDDEQHHDQTLAGTFSAARYQGKSVSTIPRTITLKLGEANIVASATSTRLPALSIPWRDGRRAVHADSQRSADQHALHRAGELPPRVRGSSGRRVRSPRRAGRRRSSPAGWSRAHSAAIHRCA